MERRHAGHLGGLHRLDQALGRARRLRPAPAEGDRPSSRRSTTRRFAIVLKEPFGLVLEALGKISSNVPFMMPKRVAETDPNKQIDDYTGSGPVHLQEGRVEARREDRLRQESQVQAAQRAALDAGRRQGGQGRPRRMARHPRRQHRGQRAARRRDRPDRGAAARPLPDAARPTRTSRCSAGTRWAARSSCASTTCIRRSTT